VPGHWEGDLIKGARNQSQIGTLVERKTLYTALYTVLVQLDNATAEHTARRFGMVLGRLDAAMRLSMTYDNGKEMARHQALSKATGIHRCTLPIPTALGSGASMRTPTVCCAVTCPRAQS